MFGHARRLLLTLLLTRGDEVVDDVAAHVARGASSCPIL
jgi:hypothetical protein